MHFPLIGASLSEPHINVKAAIFSILWYDGPLLLNEAAAETPVEREARLQHVRSILHDPGYSKCEAGY